MPDLVRTLINCFSEGSNDIKQQNRVSSLRTVPRCFAMIYLHVYRLFYLSLCCACRLCIGLMLCGWQPCLERASRSSCSPCALKLFCDILCSFQFGILILIVSFPVPSIFTLYTIYEPSREKTNNLSFRPGLTQTGLYKHRR